VGFLREAVISKNYISSKTPFLEHSLLLLAAPGICYQPTGLLR